MARATQPVTIEGIEFDALIDLSETLEAESPSYPVEEGFEVSDTIILKPLSLSMTLFLTNTPVTWKTRHGSSPSRVQDILKQLQEKYFAKKPVTVSTSERTYKNMAIISIELSKTLETGSSREIPITFQEIRVTESKTTTIPDSYGKSGATGANAGTASTTNRSTPAAKSSKAGSSNAGSSKTGSSTAGNSSTGRSGSDSESKGSILYGLASGAGLF